MFKFFNSTYKFNYLLVIVIFFLIFTPFIWLYLINRLKEHEVRNLEIYAKSQELLLADKLNEEDIIDFIFEISKKNTSIPVVMVDENNNAILWKNYEDKIFKNKELADEKIEELKNNYQPIKLNILKKPYFLYFQNSKLYDVLQYSSFIFIIIYFSIIFFIFRRSIYIQKLKKNSLWIALARETAHQLGTPLSSIASWVELIKIDSNANQVYYLSEVQNDINRLNRVASRFSKIGSVPELSKKDIKTQILNIADYYSKRVSKNIKLETIIDIDEVNVSINSDLFSWVMENLLNNSIDAIRDKKNGYIKIKLIQASKLVKIFVMDNGSGIERSKIKDIFEAGFTTKKRGWGLGLSLSRRIIEEYHSGKIYVKESTPEILTVFVIELKLIN